MHILLGNNFNSYYSVIVYFSEPEDVADAVIFLLSDRSKMVNGISLYVCGGFMSG